jgi:hypothetical protein
MNLPESIRAGYFELAKDQKGTSGMTMTSLTAFARAEARSLIAAGSSKRDIADAFELLAKECYAVACQERWMNDYALNIADTVRKAVMSVRSK